MAASDRKPNVRMFSHQMLQNADEAEQFYKIKEGLEADKENVLYRPIWDLLSPLDPVHTPIETIRQAVKKYSPLFIEKAAKVFLKTIQEKKEVPSEDYPIYAQVVYNFRHKLENEINFDCYKKVALNYLPAAEVVFASATVVEHYKTEELIELCHHHRQNQSFKNFIMSKNVIPKYSPAAIMQLTPKPANIELLEEFMPKQAEKKEEKKASDAKKEKQAPKAERRASAPSVLFPPNLRAAADQINASNKKPADPVRKKPQSNSLK